MAKFRVTYDTVDAENCGNYQFETVEAFSKVEAVNKFRKDHAGKDYTGESKVIVKVEEIK